MRKKQIKAQKIGALRSKFVMSKVRHILSMCRNGFEFVFLNFLLISSTFEHVIEFNLRKVQNLDVQSLVLCKIISMLLF